MDAVCMTQESFLLYYIFFSLISYIVFYLFFGLRESHKALMSYCVLLFYFCVSSLDVMHKKIRLTFVSLRVSVYNGSTENFRFDASENISS